MIRTSLQKLIPGLQHPVVMGGMTGDRCTEMFFFFFSSLFLFMVLPLSFFVSW